MPTLSLHQHDFLDAADAQSAPVLPAGMRAYFDAVLTTLVLEHFPLATFAALLQTLVRPGGLVLLTNMHPDMGARSQAGFIGTDGEGRQVKIRGRSWVHGVAETVEGARACGFEVVGSIGERAVTEDMLGLIGERGGKWVGCNVWYGMVLRRTIQQ